MKFQQRLVILGGLVLFLGTACLPLRAWVGQFQDMAHLCAYEGLWWALAGAVLGEIGGFYTLSATGVGVSEFPADITRKLPRYPVLPATLLGRLAVDKKYQGRGYGRFLLADALYRAVRSEIASFAVIVDAKDEAAARFYARESFLLFPDQPLKLFRPMADVARLFG